MINPNALDALRGRYPVGTRIRLIHMDDPYTSLKPGDEGTITGVDDLGTLQMIWDTGSTLGLIPGVDNFEIIKENPDCYTGKAVFVRKAANIDVLKHAAKSGEKSEPYIVEKIIELNDEEYNDFSYNLLQDYDFIKDNLALMRRDKDGTYHCLLVTAKGGKGGIFIESEGYTYCRYSAVLKV